MESVGLMEVVGDGFSRRYSCYSVTVENDGHFGHLSFVKIGFRCVIKCH